VREYGGGRLLKRARRLWAVKGLEGLVEKGKKDLISFSIRLAGADWENEGKIPL